MPEIDVVSDLLKACMEVFPESKFIQSLSHQYLVRGWLGKKQLQGLYDKARKIHGLPPGKLATLEAQILKIPNKSRSAKPEITAMYEKDEAVGTMLEQILAKYPGHKRVLFLQTRYKNNEPLSAADKAELEKFFKLLIK